MERTKRLLSLLISLVLVLLTVAIMTACGDEEENPTPGNSSTPPTSSSSDSGNNDNQDKPDDGDNKPGDSEGKKSSYTVIITDKNTGKPIPGVSVFLQEEASMTATMYARGTTDENGIVVLNAEPKYAKYVYVEGFPKGYVYENFYALGATGVEIKVGTQIIENEGNFNGKTLALGDVMYDFTLNTFSYDKETGEFVSKEIKLSELLKNGKKAVMLNFWYTTCTYCIEEFPYIQQAYEQYGEDLEIIAINAYGDTEDDCKGFLETFAQGGYYTEESCPLTFPFAIDALGIQDAFGFTVNPCSVMIDRYGVVSMIQIGGVLGPRYFTNAFDHYVADEYEQGLYSSIYDLTPVLKPDVEMSDESEIKDATAIGDIVISFRPEDGEDGEYAWPFVVKGEGDNKYIETTNIDIDGSYAILYADVKLKKGQAIMFDYFVSSERLNDVLFVIVNGKDIYTISGRPLEDDEGNFLENPWQACCPWVAEEDDIYEVAFCYVKDESDKDGDDVARLDNFRVVSEDEIEVETYIPRYAAQGLKDDNTFEKYVSVVYNEEDGYYHVGEKDGPLLLAGLVDVNTQFTLKMEAEDRYTVVIKLTKDEEFIVNGEDKYTPFIMYCNYASNAQPHGYCPVTEELRGYLEEFVKQNDFVVDENSWLQLCAYYDSYGTDKELEDPIKGLSTFSAYDAIVTEEGEEGFKNVVTYTQILMPRGKFFKFVPTKSGVYRITSKSAQEVDGWIFVGNHNQWNNENNGDRILYDDSTIGERYCPELLIDPDGDGKYERDLKNCSMISYFEEGKEYYIAIGYYDVYGAGTFAFDLKYVGEKFNKFEEASIGAFTYDLETMDTITGGIDVKLCDDEDDPRYGYYCHLLPNGELGSILYADFHYTTNIFPTQSIAQLIESNGFNFGWTATDHEAYVYFKNYYEKDGYEALEKLWKGDFEANWELYQMDDIINGIYHGRGPDLTEEARKYLDKIEDGTDGVSDEIIYPERQGCVPVDARLAELLQALMDKFSFAGIDHSWTKLCYYYKSLEAPDSVDEKLAKLEAMIENAYSSAEDVPAEITAICDELEALLENWTIEQVKKNLIDEAMKAIYEIIEIDAQKNG